MKIGAFAQKLRTQSADQKEMLGQVRWEGDKMYVYAKAGATALVPGQLTIGPAPVAGHLAMVTAAAAVGSFEVTVTPTSNNVTLNQYKDGYLHVDAVAGYGIGYRVSANPAITATNTGIISLAEPIRVALTASSTTTLNYNKQAGVVVLPAATATATAPIAGVPDIAVTASYYFWNQVKGPAAVMIRGTVVIGNLVIPDWTNSSGTAGTVIPVGSTSSIADVIKGGIVGIVERVNATATYAWINLCVPGY